MRRLALLLAATVALIGGAVSAAPPTPDELRDRLGGAEAVPIHTDPEAVPGNYCPPGGWQPTRNHNNGPVLCWFKGIEWARSSDEAWEIHRAGFRPSEWQAHVSNPTEEEIATYRSGTSFFYEYCGPGLRSPTAREIENAPDLWDQCIETSSTRALRYHALTFCPVGERLAGGFCRDAKFTYSCADGYCARLNVPGGLNDDPGTPYHDYKNFECASEWEWVYHGDGTKTERLVQWIGEGCTTAASETQVGSHRYPAEYQTPGCMRVYLTRDENGNFTNIWACGSPP